MVFETYGVLLMKNHACLYKDEKIQSVLGHFKKDFEGLVSVENLGKSNTTISISSYIS